MSFLNRLFALTAFVLVPAFALAAEEGEHHASVSGLLWRILVFSVFFVIMYILLKDRIKDGLASSVNKVRQSINDAEKACAEADKELAEYTRKMAEMKKELEVMKASARNAAEKDAETMIKEAEKSAEKFKQMTKVTIQAEIEKAKADLKRELALYAIDQAEKQLAQDKDTANKEKYISDNIIKIGA